MQLYTKEELETLRNGGVVVTDRALTKEEIQARYEQFVASNPAK